MRQKSGFPIAAQREILRLERRVFKLEQQLVRTKAKYEKQIAELKNCRRSVLAGKDRLKLIEARRKTALREPNFAKAWNKTAHVIE
jgi:hypothetical protein